MDGTHYLGNVDVGLGYCFFSGVSGCAVYLYTFLTSVFGSSVLSFHYELRAEMFLINKGMGLFYGSENKIDQKDVRKA